MPYLAPSILSADLLKLEEQIKIVEQNGADYLHVDVMDGHFVPNITFGPVIVKSLKRITSLPLDVHLMISRPEQYIQDFVAAGANIITIHQETCLHLDRLLHQIKELGCQAGISLNPATPIETISPVLSLVDLVLIMTVNPGFGGQKFIPYTLNKIRDLHKNRRKKRYSFLIEVDGGVNSETAPDLLKAGVDILVAGNSIFGQKNIAEACLRLKTLARDFIGET